MLSINKEIKLLKEKTGEIVNDDFIKAIYILIQQGYFSSISDFLNKNGMELIKYEFRFIWDKESKCSRPYGTRKEIDLL